MKKAPMPLGMAVTLLITGIFLGSIFSFGMQYWNEEVTREECTEIATSFLKYKSIRQRGSIKEIAIDCADSKRYFIDGVSVNTELT